VPLNPHEENMYAWFSGFAKAKTPHHIVNMARIIDAIKCLTDLPVAQPSEDIIRFRLTDPDCQWNNLQLTLSIKNGNVCVKTIDRDSPSMEITIQGLTAVVYGVMAYSELEYFKWIQNATPQELTTLEQWFPLTPTWMAEFF